MDNRSARTRDGEDAVRVIRRGIKNQEQNVFALACYPAVGALSERPIDRQRSKSGRAMRGWAATAQAQKKTKPALRTENRGAYIIRFTIEGNKGTVSAENYMFHVKQRALKEKSGIVPNISCERQRGPRVDFVGV